MSKLDQITIQPSRTKFHVGESGDNPTINTPSRESISIVFPWNRFTERGNLNERSRDAGRSVTSTDFFLCTCAILLLVSTITLSCVCTWSMIYRIPFLIIMDGKIQLIMNITSFLSALLNLPAFWLAWISHNDKKNYVFLPLLIIILVFAVGLSSASITIGLINKRQFNIDGNQVFLQSSFRNSINGTMHETIWSYQSNNVYKEAWDLTHTRLKCCGINNYTDWTYLQMEVPKSCYIGSQIKCIRKAGCLDRLGVYLYWEVQLILVFTFLAFMIQIISVVVASLTYF